MVHRVRLSMAILVGLIATTLMVLGIGALAFEGDSDKSGGVASIVVAIALVLFDYCACIYCIIDLGKQENKNLAFQFYEGLRCIEVERSGTATFPFSYMIESI